jgi:hypothetical protein
MHPVTWSTCGSTRRCCTQPRAVEGAAGGVAVVAGNPEAGADLVVGVGSPVCTGTTGSVVESDELLTGAEGVSVEGAGGGGGIAVESGLYECKGTETDTPGG